MAGFKTFTAAPLSVADVNGYLMAQANIQCTAATRPATPHQGMVIYQTDTDTWLYCSNATGPVWTAFSTALSSSELIYTPGSQLDGPTSTGVWVTLGNVTVPAWATKARIIINFMGIWQTGTVAETVMNVRVTVGTVNGTFIRFTGHDAGSATPVQQTLSMSESLTGLTSGSKSVTIDTSRNSGTTGTLRCGTSSRCIAFFNWLP